MPTTTTLTITDGVHDATCTAGAYASDNTSFLLWLVTAFPASSYADEASQVDDLELHGLTVDNA